MMVRMQRCGGRLEWGLATLTVIAIAGTVIGHRGASLIAESVSFGTLLVLIFLFVPMAWWRLARAGKDQETARWRKWISLA